MINLSEEQLRTHVTEFITSLNLDRYYDIEVSDEEYGARFFIEKFSDADIQAINALREKYGSTDYVNHLVEYYGDEDVVYDLAPGYEIVNIDFTQEPQYRLDLVRHELHPDGSLYSEPFAIYVSNEYLLRLICAFVHQPDMNYNRLEHFDRDLYNYLASKIEDSMMDEDFWFNCPYPFLITMDAVKEPAAQFLNDYNVNSK